jgi:MFS family permease
VTYRTRLKYSKRSVDPGQVPQERPIERAFFREAEDGTTIFFPWGLNHRGYRLTDDAAKASASRAASFLITATVAIGVWTAQVLQPILESEENGFAEVLDAVALPGAAFLLALVAYALWISRFVERFPESDLVVSREERLREAAALVEPRKIALVGAVFCGLSALVIWLQPHTWWLGLLGVALGIGVLLWSAVLRRAAADRLDRSQR